MGAEVPPTLTILRLFKTEEEVYLFEALKQPWQTLWSLC